MIHILDKITKIKNYCSCNDRFLGFYCQTSLAETRALKVLDSGTPISCTDFSRKMNLSVSRGSRIIESLVKKGILKREIMGSDRRSILLFLTDQGKELKSKMINLQTEFEQQLRKKLTRKEIDTIHDGLNLLERFFEENIKGDSYDRNDFN